MKEGANITGLNTAATPWGSGAVGACAGAGTIGEAALATLFVLASNTLLRPVVNRINRQPLQEELSEATTPSMLSMAKADPAAVPALAPPVTCGTSAAAEPGRRNRAGLCLEATTLAQRVEFSADCG